MTTRILLLDIETSPNIGYTWGKYEQNVIEFTQEWFILCAAWKWLGKGVHTVAQIDSPAYKKDRTNDQNVIEALWKVLNEAEIVVVHNGKRFDIPKINARFLVHGLTPPSPYKVVDTLTIARNSFKFDSNKLDDLGKSLKLSRKLETGGFSLWKECMSGDEQAWKKMVRYNKQDVQLLEQLYLRIRPWINNHPAFNVVGDKPHNCPICQGIRIQSRGYERRANGRQSQRFQCQGCGKWFYGLVKRLQTV